MNKFFTTLLAAACEAGLSAGELKIVKAAYGNGEQVNDVTEAFLKHVGGLPGTFLTITPSNKFFAPDPAPRKAKTLTVTYTDGGAEKSVRIPERQFGSWLQMPTPRRSSRCCARSTVPAGSGKR